MADSLTQGKIRILCVGIDPGRYREFARGFPVEIEEAAGVSQGLAKARRMDPCLIIGGEQLSCGGTGTQLLALIREDALLGSCAFVLITDRAEEFPFDPEQGPDEVWDPTAGRDQFLRRIHLLSGLKGQREALERSESMLDRGASLLGKQKKELEKSRRATLNDRKMLQNTLRQVTLMAAERDRLKKEAACLSGINIRNREGIVTLLSSLIEAKPACRRGHSVNVSKIALFMAKERGIQAEELRDIEVAGLLHEVGRLSVPDALSLKPPAEYTDRERDRLDRHPLRGEALLGAFEGLEGVARIIRHIHERFEGTGVPDGLKREEIPLGARIIALANIYENLAFRDAGRTLGDIFSIIESHVGTRYDAKLVGGLHRYAAAHPPMGTERCIELDMFELKPGYVLVSGIYTALGAKLLPGNTVLTEKVINRIAQYNKIDPLDEKVFVKGTVQ